MDINFCILLVYIFLRNFMAFDKKLAILYGFFNLKISKKTALLEKSPNLVIFLRFDDLITQSRDLGESSLVC